MLEFQEKRRIKKILYSPPVVLLLVIFLGICLKGVWGVYQKSAYAKENLERVSDSYNNLQDRERILNQEIDYLKTSGGKEEEMRERFGLAKPDEDVVIIVNQGDTRTSPEYLPDKNTWWKKIRSWLKL